MLDITRRQALLVLIAVAALAATAIGVHGLLLGPHHAPPPQAATIGTTTNGQPNVQPATHPAVIADRTNDPVTYARWVAATLFDWDTATGYQPSDYTAPLLADGDPSGEEMPGLIGDVSSYVPTTEQWLNLATMNVAQTITITTATVPADWPSIAATAHGQLRPGTSAVTIIGTRHRTGAWNGDPQTADGPVSFTVFVACRPTFDRCHLLRLSELNQPLP